ncbi:MAG: CPBP family intramembrane metalloprotease [Bacteroidales bacterium]|nr:CPBP family intramembrane metalloprotease [Candidatus Cryptobacteroides onthequi]
MGKVKRTVRNYDLFSGFQYYTPGVSGMLALLLWLLAGACIGSLITMLFGVGLGADAAMEYGTLISYPVMFIPAMMYASLKSKSNALWDKGYALDSSHFGRAGALACALMAAAAVFVSGFMSDLVNSLLPPMPEWLEDALSSMTEGRLWVNLLCVSVFAPLFEEWLCRGMILRGLLNARKSTGERTVSPAWAIVISALFFALIHANPWQAVPAFIIGCLFGYIYFKTGSLKLTMLMHCVNNTVAVICSRLECFEGKDYWSDVLGPKLYGVLFAAAAVILFLILREFSRIPLQSPSGNCDETGSEE